MPTRKSTKRVASKKAGAKKQVKRKRRTPKLQDPPIIVGGGGSTYVWLSKGNYRQLIINIPKPPGPYAADRYDCFKFDNNVARVDVHDGDNPKDPVNVSGKPKHRTLFR